MIRDLRSYLSDEAKPRIRKIIGGSELWIALACGILIGGWGDRFVGTDLKVGDIVSSLLAYSAIALGFCLSGLIIALTLPDREFAKLLATHRASASSPNSYSNLMFVFSWTAIAHWVEVLGVLALLVFRGTEAQVFPLLSNWHHRLVIGAVGFVASYALFQFLIAVITLSMVGRLYIDRLIERRETGGHG